MKKLWDVSFLPSQKEATHMSESLANNPPKILPSSLSLFTDMVGNEAGNDLRKSWISPSILKSLRRPF